ncbi:MAG: thioredoxin [Robiginitomaculum sp.]|nr:thioredoxin [Robiginitomaculum sp.]
MTEQQPDTQNLIIDGTDAGFMAEVIEPSSTVPVIVDFWAPWCGPCRQLGPALEKLVKRAGGKVKMVKINVDENPAISGQLQVRSIPAVFAFKDGQPVDGFSGALPESQLQEFIDKLTGDMDVDKEVADLVERANKSFELGDLGGAAQDYAAAISLKEDAPEAIAGMIRVYLANDDVLSARNILQSVTEESLQHVDIIGAGKAIELAEGAPSNDEMQPLFAAVKNNPNDFKARFALAEGLSGIGKMDQAMDELFVILETELNWNDQQARKMLLKLFEAAGSGSEITAKGRRRLSSLLFN